MYVDIGISTQGRIETCMMQQQPLEVLVYLYLISVIVEREILLIVFIN